MENDLPYFFAKFVEKESYHEKVTEVVNVLLEFIDRGSYNYYDNLKIFLEQNEPFHIIYARWKSFCMYFNDIPLFPCSTVL